MHLGEENKNTTNTTNTTNDPWMHGHFWTSSVNSLVLRGQTNYIYIYFHYYTAKYHQPGLEPGPLDPDSSVLTSYLSPLSESLVKTVVRFTIQCSKACLPGQRTNYTKCSRVNDWGEIEEVSDIQCQHEPGPPSITEPCNDDNPCKGKWTAHTTGHGDKKTHIFTVLKLIWVFHVYYNIYERVKVSWENNKWFTCTCLAANETWKSCNDRSPNKSFVSASRSNSNLERWPFWMR